MRKGLSIVELLLGLVILTVVMAIAYRGMVEILRIQGTQEAITTSQTKLRRTLEVISQDVRGAVFGGILSQPYASNSSAFSLALLAGGAGYPVLQYASPSATSISFIADDPSAEFVAGTYGFMLAEKKGVLLPVTVAASGGSSTSPTWSMGLGCGVTLPFTATAPPLLFRTDAVGYRYDAPSKTLFFQRLGEAAQPVAYDITEFKVDYVYSNNTSFSVNPVGYNAGGVIALKLGSSTLDRLRITLSTEEPAMGRMIRRTMSSEVELINNLTMPLEGTVNCS
jgi:prepilin-type N-terminal cleavage/methylation domain-containing protein